MRKAALSLLTTVAITMTATTSAMAEIAWQENLRAAHTQAQAEGKLLLLHFYSDNCVWCDRLEAGSFKAPQVGQAVSKDFIPVKIHANTNPKLTEMFKVTKFPTDVIVTTSGKTLSHSVSPQKSDRYVAMLTDALPTPAVSNAPLVAKAGPGPVSAPRGQVAETSPAQTVPATVGPSAKLGAPAASVQANVPAYAKSTAPELTANAEITPPSPNSGDSPSGFALPSGLNVGVQGTLAGARTNELSFEMPSPTAAPTATEPIGLLAPNASPKPAATAPASSAVSLESPEPTAGATAVVGDAATTPPIELAMQGFCAVTVINESRWAEGSPQHGVIHLGKLYLFVSDKAMQTFLADPVPYTPVLNEIDVVRFFEERKIVQGKRELGVQDPIHHRMFFFADEASRDHFENSYERYTDAAIEVMDKAVKDANPGT